MPTDIAFAAAAVTMALSPEPFQAGLQPGPITAIGSTVVTTNDEHLLYGFGPGDMARRDKVCVLQGCPGPVILRPVGDHHILIGEAKVPRIVNGGAIKEIEERYEEPQDFMK